MYEAVYPSRYPTTFEVSVRLISNTNSDEGIMKEPIEDLMEFFYNNTSPEFINNLTHALNQRDHLEAII